ncbi:MAG: hypothetical protein ACK5JH_08045 [Anaerocolumna sp.]
MDANELRQKRDKAPFHDHNMKNFVMYDLFPYKMDINLCPRESHKLISGNIIKYSTYFINETFLVNSN